MVAEGLNKIAVGLGEQARGILEDEVVALDVDVCVAQHEYDELVQKMREANLRANDLHRERDAKQVLLRSLDGDIRELKRPRDGFPYLDDLAYEARMLELRVSVHEVAEELEKRAAWTE